MIVGSVPAKVGHRQTLINNNAPKGALLLGVGRGITDAPIDVTIGIGHETCYNPLVGRRNGRDTAHFLLAKGFPASYFRPHKMDLRTLLEKTLPGMGYELVDVETSPGGRLVRVYIDKADGIVVEDCARVSDHLTRLLTVENVDYERLEVSSPGLDRPLRKAADFERFSGQEAQIRLKVLADNRRNFTGTLRGMRDGKVVVETETGESVLALENIDRARLVPKIDWSRK